MSAIRSGILNISTRLDTLEKKAFWLLTVLTSLFGFVSVVVTIGEGGLPMSVISALLCALAPLLSMAFCKKTGNYDIAYILLCVMINIILLPVSFFLDGGLRSGMPIILAGAMILISFVFSSGWRWIIFACSLAVDVIGMAASVYRPELVIPIADDMVETDTIYSFAFISVAILLLLELILNEYKAAIEKERFLNEQKASLRLDIMEAQHENVEAVQRMRHDARHHNAVILEMLHNGEYEQLEKYMQSKMSGEDDFATVIYCMNSVVNSILSVYTRKAQKAGISTEIRADVPADIGISGPDLVAMLSNIYENAIHGAVASGKEEKKILLMIHPKGGHIAVRCDNTCKDGLELVNGFPGPGPGTGIRSIVTAVQKYDGQLSYSISQGELSCRLVFSIE